MNTTSRIIQELLLLPGCVKFTRSCSACDPKCFWPKRVFSHCMKTHAKRNRNSVSSLAWRDWLVPTGHVSLKAIEMLNNPPLTVAQTLDIHIQDRPAPYLPKPR